jgi:hypothetical protein
MSKLQKFLCNLLIFVLAITNFHISVVHAAQDVQINALDGEILIDIVGTKATYSTKYQTTGWIVYKEPRCDTSVIDNRQQCDPRKGNTNPLAGKYGYIWNGEPYQEIPDKPSTGDMTSRFKISEDNVMNALISAGLGDIQDGDIIYLSSIFQLKHGDVLDPDPKYYTLTDIRNAAGWTASTMGDFPYYYDLAVTYHANPASVKYPVDAIYKTTAGAQLKQVPKGTFKADEKVSHSFETLLSVSGKRYKLVQSYITTKKPPSTPAFVQNTGDPNLSKRNITVSDGGNNFVGVYEEDANCTGCAGDTPPAPETMTGKDMTPNPSTTIKADDARNAGVHFDVLKGIPTSEYLHVNTLTKNYLFDFTYNKKAGRRKYDVTVKKTYTLTWQEPGSVDDQGNITWVDKSQDYPVSITYPIYRDFTYWVVSHLETYGVQKADVDNFALPSGQVTLTPKGYTPPDVSTAHSDAESDHVFDPEYQKVVDLPGQTINGGQGSPPTVPQEDFTAQAEDAVPKIQVKNDRLDFNSSNLMSDAKVEQDGPRPSPVPAPTVIGPTVLDDSYQIAPTKANYYQAQSKGTIYYNPVPGGVGSASDKNYPIPGINHVTVHTPVVNYSTTSDEWPYNQKTVPTAGRNAFILDRPFTVKMPTVGQHLNIEGYKNRDYAKYTKNKQVWFPFDVFTEDKKQFIPKNTWIDIDVDQESFIFFLPVWVDEGFYDVLFREIAINCPAVRFETEHNANKDWIMSQSPPEMPYVATESIPVEVIGRVYDFHITDVADYNWQSVFRQNDGTTPRGSSYWVGDLDIDGKPSGNDTPYELPVRQGSHPNQGTKNIAVKTGYHFKFDLKTKGNMFGSDDGIRITPTFYFVDKNGNNRQEVDLYYRTNDKPFVRIGSSDDTEKRYVVLNEPLRNVPNGELRDTSDYLYSHGYTFGGAAATNKDAFYATYLRYAERKTWVGDYSLMLLTQPLRTFIGDKVVPDGVDVARANAAVQKWYGEYSLPAAPYAVLKGTNLAEYGRTHSLEDKAPIFLKNGYLIVNFNIETIRNQDVTHPHLQYLYGPLDKQWRMEGFRDTVKDPYGVTFHLQDGDVVFYHADKSSRDDFDSNGTH